MAKEINSGRRRVPRRSFDARIGILLHGEYSLGQAYQVGEGGMMVSCESPVEVGTQMVISFVLSAETMIIVRGVVRSTVDPEYTLPRRYGVEFLNLDFQFKREIRNFVAAATRVDGPIAL